MQTTTTQNEFETGTCLKITSLKQKNETHYVQITEKTAEHEYNVKLYKSTNKELETNKSDKNANYYIKTNTINWKIEIIPQSEIVLVVL